MPEKMLQDLPSSADDVQDAAGYAGKVGWTGFLFMVGLGVAAIVLAILRGVPFLGNLIGEGQAFLSGESSAQTSEGERFLFSK